MLPQEVPWEVLLVPLFSAEPVSTARLWYSPALRPLLPHGHSRQSLAPELGIHGKGIDIHGNNIRKSMNSCLLKGDIAGCRDCHLGTGIFDRETGLESLQWIRRRPVRSPSLLGASWRSLTILFLLAFADLWVAIHSSRDHTLPMVSSPWRCRFRLACHALTACRS